MIKIPLIKKPNCLSCLPTCLYTQSRLVHPSLMTLTWLSSLPPRFRRTGHHNNSCRHKGDSMISIKGLVCGNASSQPNSAHKIHLRPQAKLPVGTNVIIPAWPVSLWWSNVRVCPLAGAGRDCCDVCTKLT